MEGNPGTRVGRPPKGSETPKKPRQEPHKDKKLTINSDSSNGSEGLCSNKPYATGVVLFGVLHFAFLLTGAMTWFPSFVAQLIFRSLVLPTILIIWFPYVISFLVLSASPALEGFSNPAPSKKNSSRSANFTDFAIGLGLLKPKSRPGLCTPILLALIFFAIEAALFIPSITAVSPTRAYVESDIIFTTFGNGTPPNPMPHSFSFFDYLKTIIEPSGPFLRNLDYPHKTIEYKQDCGHPACEIDVYTPPGAVKAPIIIHIHGGAWMLGEKSGDVMKFGYYLERGYGIVSVGYPYIDGKKNTFRELIDDCIAAFHFVREHAREWKMDPDRIVMTGESAGGHLATVTAYMVNSTSIKGVFNIYGATELDHLRFNAPSTIDRHIFTDPFPLGVGGKDKLTVEALKEFSASTYAHTGSPPTLSLHPDSDTIVDLSTSKKLHDALSRHNVTNLLITIPTYNHACDILYHTVCAQIERYVFERFLSSVLK